MYTNLKKSHAKGNILKVTDITNKLTSRFYDSSYCYKTNIIYEQ